MVKHNKKSIEIILLFFISFISIHANIIPKEIITCLKSGNSKALTEYLYHNVELQILENENVYSQAQAEQIIKSFFEQNKPVDFIIIHQSGKEGSEYAIGTLVTENGKFRVYFLIKTQGDKGLIHQLSIKKENG